MTEAAKPRDLVYTPNEVARFTLEELERRKANKRAGIPMGLSTVDKVVNPLRPGELVTILGRPSHYKSGLAQWWARTMAERMLAEEAQDVVAYGTCEMSIEELGLYDLAVQARLDASMLVRGEYSDSEFAALQAAAMRRGCLPLWLLGHSLARRRKRIRMSIWTIEQALYWIEDNMDFRARIVFLDYLNLIISDRKPGERPERRVDIAEIVQCAKDLALSLGCPVVMLAQANRRADDRDNWRMPHMADAMESAAIEQYSDKVFGVFMPKVEGKSTLIKEPDGTVQEVTDNLLYLGLLKQKNGPAGGYFRLYVDPKRNFVAPMASRQGPMAEDEPANVPDTEPIPF